MEKNLITIEEKTITAVFEEKGLQPFIDEIQLQVDSFVVPADLSKKKDRDKIRKFAYKIAQWKTKIDKTGKEFLAEKKKELKTCDAERKRLRDFCEKIQEEVRSPLTVWEEEDKARIVNIQVWIENIKTHDKTEQEGNCFFFDCN